MSAALSRADTALDFHIHATRHRRDPKMTVAGIVAHQSALKDGELMKIPQYS